MPGVYVLAREITQQPKCQKLFAVSAILARGSQLMNSYGRQGFAALMASWIDPCEKLNMRTLVSHNTGSPRSIVRASTRNKDTSQQTDKRAVLESSLEKTGRGELKKVRVEVERGSVCLRGCVSSYFLKQLAQEAVRPFAIELDLNIDNQLCVSDGVWSESTTR